MGEAPELGSVAKVRITIQDEQQQWLQQGEAAQVNDAWWEFEASAPTEAKVIAEASDLAGNCTRYEA